jgi:hypothetical protein
MSVRLLVLLVVAANFACAAWRDTTPTVDESRIARRLHADPQLEVLVLRGDEAGRVVARDRSDGAVSVLAEGVIDAVWGHGALFAVLSDGALWRIERDSRERLLDKARHGLALLGDGSVIAVAGPADETDLWRVEDRGVKRPLASAPGSDRLPLALDDGRVAFVSDRDGAPAIFVVDPYGGAARRLSQPLPRIAGGLQQVDGAIVLSDAEGSRWTVSLADGRALPSDQAG